MNEVYSLCGFLFLISDDGAQDITGLVRDPYEAKYPGLERLTGEPGQPNRLSFQDPKTSLSRRFQCSEIDADSVRVLSLPHEV